MWMDVPLRAHSRVAAQNPFSKKIKTFKGERHLLKLKYIILIVFVILLPIAITYSSGYGKPWFCKLICPSGTLLGGVPLVATNPVLQNTVGLLFSWKVGLLIIILIASMAIHRPFCKYVCPLGAIYGGFNKISLLQYHVNADKCTHCNYYLGDWYSPLWKKSSPAGFQL